MKSEHQALKDKIEGIQIVMLTTHTNEGHMRARPMAIQEMEDDGTLWIFTALDGGAVAEIYKRPEVCLGFASGGKDTYVSVSGTAKVIPAQNDPGRLNKLWTDWLKAYFPKGNDPNIAMLSIEPLLAEYWDQPGGKMVGFFNEMRAILTGDPGKVTENMENKELTF
jgi:general stress protein 26